MRMKRLTSFLLSPFSSNGSSFGVRFLTTFFTTRTFFGGGGGGTANTRVTGTIHREKLLDSTTLTAPIRSGETWLWEGRLHARNAIFRRRCRLGQAWGCLFLKSCHPPPTSGADLLRPPSLSLPSFYFSRIRLDFFIASRDFVSLNRLFFAGGLRQ